MADRSDRKSKQTPASSNNTNPAPQVELLPPDVRDLVSALPAEKRGRAVQILLARSTSHTGPIPSPEAFERYGQTLGNAPDRILRMAEKQSDHRIEVERQAIRRQLNQSGAGQILAALLAICCIGAATWLSLHDHDTVAGIIGGTTVVGLVTVFVYGKKSQQKDLKQKKEV